MRVPHRGARLDEYFDHELERGADAFREMLDESEKSSGLASAARYHRLNGHGHRR
jgi:hypothetical protein